MFTDISRVNPFFIDKSTGKIYRHPVVGFDGESHEKSIYRKRFYNSTFTYNRNLKKQIEEFLKTYPELNCYVFSTQKTNNERMKEFLNKDRKKIKSLLKVSCFSLDDEDLKKIVRSSKKEGVKYIIGNLNEGELEKWGSSILEQCMIFKNDELFDFIIRIGENINLDTISVKSIKYGFFDRICEEIRKRQIRKLLNRSVKDICELISQINGGIPIISLLKGEDYFIEEGSEIYIDFYNYFSKFVNINTFSKIEKFDFNNLHVDEAIKIGNKNIIEYLSMNGCEIPNANFFTSFFKKIF